MRRRVLRRFLPPAVRDIVVRVTEAGHQAYLVGGCVRDALRGQAPADWDVATSADPGAVTALFPDVRPTGLPHGMVTVIARGRPVEVTTFRTEGSYSDHRHPDRVAFTDDVVQDLARRDVTVNAMALDLGGGLVDPFGGLEDLEAGRLRAVGDPAARLREDALRIVRICRLAAQLGFAVDPPTEAAMAGAARLLRHVSVERVRYELERLMGCRPAAPGLDLAARSGVLPILFPELAVLDGRLWRHTVGCIDALDQPAGPAGGRPDGPGPARLAALFHALPQPAAAARRRLAALRWSKAMVGAVSATVALLSGLWAVAGEPGGGDAPACLHALPLSDRKAPEDTVDVYRVRCLLGSVEPPVAWAAIDLGLACAGGTVDIDRSRAGAGHRVLQAAADCLRRGDPLTVNDLAVSGRDIMDELGIGPGPRVGRILRLLLDLVRRDPRRNTREDLLTALRDSPADPPRRD